MKLTLSTVTALMLSTAAAMAFSFPAHQQDGWRDTGCLESANVAIKNDKGEVLYYNNATCPTAPDAAIGGTLADLIGGLTGGDETETAAK